MNQTIYIKDFFILNLQYDGIITDIPYVGAIKNKLNEENFDMLKFLKKTDKETPDNSFLITFCNMRCLLDLVELLKQTNWKFHTYQIWNKEPARSWISYSMPLRTCEFILYLKKGKFKFNFTTGILKPKVKRNSFGGSLKNTKPNKNEFSKEMYSEIITFPIVKKTNRIHPTQKPIEFSEMFIKIVGSDKLVCDPCMGSGNLLQSFENYIGVDIKEWK